jgi:hypothetical protein
MPAIARRIIKGPFGTATQAFVEFGIFEEPNSRNLIWSLEPKTSGALGRTLAGLKTSEKPIGKDFPTITSLLREINNNPDNFTNKTGFFRVYVRNTAFPRAKDRVKRFFFDDITPSSILFMLREFEIQPSKKLLDTLRARGTTLKPQKPLFSDILKLRAQRKKERARGTLKKARL